MVHIRSNFLQNRDQANISDSTLCCDSQNHLRICETVLFCSKFCQGLRFFFSIALRARESINLSCVCWQIPESFAARSNKIQSIWVTVVGRFQNLSCAAEQNAVNQDYFLEFQPRTTRDWTWRQTTGVLKLESLQINCYKPWNWKPTVVFKAFVWKCDTALKFTNIESWKEIAYFRMIPVEDWVSGYSNLSSKFLMHCTCRTQICLYHNLPLKTVVTAVRQGKSTPIR
jgi:hypothetical protein